MHRHATILAINRRTGVRPEIQCNRLHHCAPSLCTGFIDHVLACPAIVLSTMAHVKYNVHDDHRRSGFARPWDVLQVTSWGLIVMFFTFFYIFNGPFLRPPFNVVACVLYGCVAVCVVGLNYVTARSDAADPAIWTKISEHEMYESDIPIPPGKTLCQTCRAYVDRYLGFSAVGASEMSDSQCEWPHGERHHP